jgi:hypothetical protein
MDNVKRWIALCGIMPVLCVSCVFLMDKTGQALDGSAFEEKNIAVYRSAQKEPADMEIREVRNRAGIRSIIITLGEFPAVQIRGTAPDAGGNFYFLSLDYLGSNIHGWNEYRLDLSGAGSLTLNTAAAVLFVPGEFQAVQISSGRIHRYDTRITGDEALTGLRNRRERILALAEWMGRQQGPRGLNGDEFEKYWKPVFFPELVSKKKRPALWQQDNDQWIRAEGVRWNSGYTERVFPEILWAIRNSGTMLRDWEEALEWIRLEYEWGRLVELLSRETTLRRVKK